MNKVFKKITATAGAVALLAITSIGMAAPAHAVTTSQYTKWIGGTTCQWWVFVDYNWWEETFQGKRDYQYLKLTGPCPTW